MIKLDHETKLEITKWVIVGSLCIAFFIQFVLPSMQRSYYRDTWGVGIPNNYNRGYGFNNINVFYNDELFKPKNDITIVLSDLEIGCQYKVNITQFDNQSTLFNSLLTNFKARRDIRWIPIYTSSKFNTTSALRVEIYLIQVDGSLLVDKTTFYGDDY